MADQEQTEILTALASDRVYLVNRINGVLDNIILNGIPTLFKKGQRTNMARHMAIHYCKANATRISSVTGETTESVFGIAEMDKEAESRSLEWPTSPLPFTQQELAGKLKRDLFPGEEAVAVRSDGSLVDVKSKGAIDMTALRAEITAQVKADLAAEATANKKADIEALVTETSKKK